MIFLADSVPYGNKLNNGDHSAMKNPPAQPQQINMLEIRGGTTENPI